jgi:hypothetical protein
MSIDSLRPGVEFQSKSLVEVVNPADVVISVLTTHLESSTLKTSNGKSCPLNVGSVIVTASGQKGCDGLVILDGSVSTNGKKKTKRKVLIFSQSKKQETSGVTGLPSGSTLYDGTIGTSILPRMRDMAKVFKQKHTQFKDAFIVYDIFSDRENPKGGNPAFQLTENEGMFVTRSANLDEVLGGLAARKRPIVL